MYNPCLFDEDFSHCYYGMFGKGCLRVLKRMCSFRDRNVPNKVTEPGGIVLTIAEIILAEKNISHDWLVRYA